MKEIDNFWKRFVELNAQGDRSLLLFETTTQQEDFFKALLFWAAGEHKVVEQIAQKLPFGLAGTLYSLTGNREKALEAASQAREARKHTIAGVFYAYCGNLQEVEEEIRSLLAQGFYYNAAEVSLLAGQEIPPESKWNIDGEERNLLTRLKERLHTEENLVLAHIGYQLSVYLPWKTKDTSWLPLRDPHYFEGTLRR